VHSEPLGFFNHGLPIHTSVLLARKLPQQLSHKLRAFVGLLLDLAFADGVQRPEQPHFLQVANEHLQVFCGFDLREINQCLLRMMVMRGIGKMVSFGQ
jgi:hypothetical protein